MTFALRYRGVSLIELMISMVLASIIAAAAIAMLVGDSQSSRFQINKVSAHTSGRFAFDFILADLRKAGYSDKTIISTPVSGINSNIFSTSDQLIIKYDAALADQRDCVGNEIVLTDPAANTVTNDYRVQLINGVNTLTCNGSPLMGGVDGFQILFGVDQDEDGELDSYVTPGNESGFPVITVQLAMLVTVQEGRGENVTTQYDLLGVNSGALLDNRVRMLFSTTERIRNVNLDAML